MRSLSISSVLRIIFEANTSSAHHFRRNFHGPLAAPILQIKAAT
jgi:hypothetical protein